MLIFYPCQADFILYYNRIVCIIVDSTGLLPQKCDALFAVIKMPVCRRSATDFRENNQLTCKKQA
ncbi:hypothetical protein Cst_c20850 [Thermoclostridium stercorarium subsp. stercorarium DSM 8532]|uniref:Uncharacterized protein n=3 Tax=Thermoclostridium stercorarium TaxID=1510 RepID=L7VTZ7_THES1|nr:hypothetical protein Cst_c20850 [Thermoclostridium stercorarium subsp. stercorarium DSM 8532]ANW99350.1 hypothetical protein CSTERTH_10055 [Thermoclostridium stercorarium subsp. thermolacticum DSM 2910]ANX01978.1 hypothetical protein CSTERLE_10540 [Thermoclostridium stercorarium subsp. leptospartum DSM 9219]